ncbi:MAG TPA: peptidylprolyl isomerase [Aquabacterium sp.]|nr:peptidylprolyl isomerase [Aquabacterium sp.]
MKISRIAQAAVLAASLSLAAPLVLAQNVAVVNGKGVPKARVDAMVDQILKQNKGQGQPLEKSPELEQKVKDEVVLREIFVQEAEKRGLQTAADYKTQMEFARQSILIRALFADFEKKHPVTEAMARAEYDKIKAGKGGDKEYRARHILVETEDQAKDLIAQLNKGAKFEDLAKKYSKDPGSAQNGGDLDWASPDNYVPEFSKAMMQLEKGKYTQEPVKSQFGYHIIELEDERNVQFPAFEDVKAQITQHLQQEQLQKFRDDLKKQAKTDYKFSGGN